MEPAPPPQQFREYRALPGSEINLFSYVRLQQWEWPNLSAPAWRLYFNDANGASISIGKTCIPLHKGIIYLIPPNTPFSSHTAREVGHLYVHFTTYMHYLPEHGRIFEHAPSREEKAMVIKVLNILQTGSPSAGLHAMFWVHALVNIALANVPLKYWGNDLPNPRIQEAIQHIKANYPAGLSNEELAKRVRMSTNSLMRLFRQVTGQSPHLYLLTLRLEEASQLLHYSDLSIEEIAEKTAFYDRFHLSKTFKQHLKISPAKFRQKPTLNL